MYWMQKAKAWKLLNEKTFQNVVSGQITRAANLHLSRFLINGSSVLEDYFILSFFFLHPTISWHTLIIFKMIFYSSLNLLLEYCFGNFTKQFFQNFWNECFVVGFLKEQNFWKSWKICIAFIETHEMCYRKIFFRNTFSFSLNSLQRLSSLLL